MRILPEVNAPICGVRAIALATAVKTDEDVLRYFRIMKNKSRRWVGRMYLSELLSALEFFDVRFSDYGPRFNGKTVNRLLDHLISGNHYIIFVTGHFFTVKDGVLYDQHYVGGVAVRESRWRLKRVKRVIRIDS